MNTLCSCVAVASHSLRRRVRLLSLPAGVRKLSDALPAAGAGPPQGSYTEGEVLVVGEARDETEAGLVRAALSGLRVLHDFVTVAEERALLDDVEPRLRRMRYQHDHWDNAIEGYRETEVSWEAWSVAGRGALQRARRLLLPGDAAPLPHVHVLDLHPDGHIRPHIDAVKFCGSAVCGVCLAGGATLRLDLEHRPHLALEAHLPPRSVYCMTGAARYQFRHAVVRRAGQRGRRVSLLLRTEPHADPHHAPPTATTTTTTTTTTTATNSV